MKKIKFKKGFTLIELLVVIAIIGILSSVVLASLNSARTKGQVAAIKSNLKNMIAQAELSYDANGDYSTACASVSNMITAINNSGGTAACYSHDNLRWGVSAKLNSDTTKNYSVDGNGVVVWDTDNASVPAISWDAANIACSTIGGKLPSLEQLKALSLVYGLVTPPSLSWISWSSTIYPLNTALVYYINKNDGVVSTGVKASTIYARCVH